MMRNKKGVMVAGLMALLFVGTIAIVGMIGQSTGNTVVNTGSRGRQQCECAIEAFDFYGNSLGVQIFHVRHKSRQISDSQCQTRCEQHFGGRSRRGKIVTGRIDR